MPRRQDEKLNEDDNKKIIDWFVGHYGLVRELAYQLGLSLKYEEFVEGKEELRKGKIRKLLEMWEEIKSEKATLGAMLTALEETSDLTTSLREQINMGGPEPSDGLGAAFSSRPRDVGWTETTSPPGPGGTQEGTGTGRKRRALLVANTYTESLSPLQGTKTSMEKMKTALEGKGFKETRELLNETVETLERTLTEWVKETEDAEARVFYFCGHGGYCGYKETSGSETGSKVAFSGDTGNIRVGGDYIQDNKFQKMFKNKIMYILYKDQDPAKHGHVIAIFDCCRGDKDVEKKMSSKPTFTLQMESDELEELNNCNYKNSYVFHATLPHQVAWCISKSEGTKFSKYFCEALSEKKEIAVMDEFINEKLNENPGLGGHKQMVQLDKRVIKPFKWN